MIRTITVKDLVMMSSEDALRRPCRLKVFSFELINGQANALILSTDLHNYLVIKDLSLLTKEELKYFKSYLKDLVVCPIPSGPLNVQLDRDFAFKTYGVHIKSVSET